MTLYVVFLQVLFRFGEQQRAHIENIARKGNMSKAGARRTVDLVQGEVDMAGISCW